MAFGEQEMRLNLEVSLELKKVNFLGGSVSDFWEREVQEVHGQHQPMSQVE
jgi:hypothetical protein